MNPTIAEIAGKLTKAQAADALERLSGEAMRLAEAAAVLNVATDGMEALRPQRQAVVDALEGMHAALAVRSHLMGERSATGEESGR